MLPRAHITYLHLHLTSYIIIILDHAQVLCLVSHLHLFPILLLLCTFDCAWDGSAWDADQIAHAHTHTHIAGRSMFDVYPLLLRLGGLGGEHATRAWKTQHREENRKTSTFANNQTRFHHVTSPSWGRSLCLFIHLGTAPKKTRSFNLWQTHPSLLLWMLASLSVSMLVYHHRTISELGASTPPGSSCRNV